jgi:hypothetical protein
MVLKVAGGDPTFELHPTRKGQFELGQYDFALKTKFMVFASLPVMVTC